MEVKYTMDKALIKSLPADSQAFRPLEVSHNTYDHNWHSTMHHHSYYEMFYCLSGTGQVVTQLRAQNIQHNNLILINPFIEHTEYSENQSLNYIIIGFYGPDFKLPGKARETGLFFFNDLTLEYVNYFKDIIKVCEQKNIYREAIITYLLNVIMLKLHDLTDSVLTESKSMTLSPNINLAKNYIDNHYAQDIKLADLEAYTHLSRYHLSREFKKEVGKSPIEYLNSVRMSQAREFLETTSLAINQTAKLTGFSSASYFTSQFKLYYGQSPTSYRKSIWQNK